MHSSYKSLILYFLTFNTLLLTSALLIYSIKIGFIPSEVVEYYSAKTIVGVLKVNLPHIFLFGLFGMVLLHFLIFTNYKNDLKKLSYTFFTSAFFELVSPLLIIGGLDLFAYVKIVSFIIFYFVIIYISILLLLDIVNN